MGNGRAIMDRIGAWYRASGKRTRAEDRSRLFGEAVDRILAELDEYCPGLSVNHEDVQFHAEREVRRTLAPPGAPCASRVMLAAVRVPGGDTRRRLRFLLASRVYAALARRCLEHMKGRDLQPGRAESPGNPPIEWDANSPPVEVLATGDLRRILAQGAGVPPAIDTRGPRRSLGSHATGT